MARRKPKPQAPNSYDPHVFAANIHGPKDYRGDPIECLHCPLLRWNGVHITSEELAESLPPTHPNDRSGEMIGEREEAS